MSKELGSSIFLTASNSGILDYIYFAILYPTSSGVSPAFYEPADVLG